ncbi:MAG: tetraacyldisaccharide 4'-kinase [Alphaproteobacteria bacterium]|nr:tetraacyldisaccharide 4'-kinase [Alphaproteobacteria bacterium]
MRAPRFWSHGYELLPALLSPLSWLYGLAERTRRATATPARAPVPVICLGNITVGGAGKTPATIAVAGFLKQRGRNPHILMRGYGGSTPGPLRVDPNHTATEVGDEAILLARIAPTWIGADRVETARFAVAAGADVLVMDDGFQNPHLKQDLSFLVVDGGFGLGNGRLIPAGPLRESPARALARATAVIYIVDPGGDASGPPPRGLERVPVFPARLEPTAEAAVFVDHPVVAFAGIGRPAKFFNTLRAMGIRVTDTYSFPDHHAFQPDELMTVIDDAVAAGAKVVTTEKDAVRLPPEARDMVEVLRVTLQFEDPQALETMLSPVVDD